MNMLSPRSRALFRVQLAGVFVTVVAPGCNCNPLGVSAATQTTLGIPSWRPDQTAWPA